MSTDNHLCAVVGVIADVQCAYVANAWNYKKTSMRFYQRAMDQLDYSLQLMAEENVTEVLQLGDLLDGFCRRDNSTLRVLTRLKQSFQTYADKMAFYHIIGNHDLYNLSRHTLCEEKSTFLIDKSIEALIQQSAAWTEAHRPVYYSLNHISHWKILVLDAYDFSVLGLKEDHPQYQAAYALLSERNNNPDKNEPNSTEPWFVAFNGGIGRRQLAWMRAELNKARTSGLNVIVASHVPTHPKAVFGVVNCVLWNHEEVLGLLREYADCVRLYLAGHTHEAEVHLDACAVHHPTQGILHVTLPGVVEMNCDVGTARPHCTLKLFPTSFSLQGSLGIPDHCLSW